MFLLEQSAPRHSPNAGSQRNGALFGQR